METGGQTPEKKQYFVFENDSLKKIYEEYLQKKTLMNMNQKN